jgi:hypothetical protein
VTSMIFPLRALYFWIYSAAYVYPILQTHILTDHSHCES